VAHAARLIREVEQFGTFGISTDLPEVSWPALLAHTQQTIYRLQEKKQLLGNLIQAGVQVYSEVGESHFLDPHTLALKDGVKLEADKYIISAGGHGRRLTFPGSELTVTHSDVWGLQALPRSVIIVGGAATGCQLTSIFNAFGVQVTLMERSPNILSLEDTSISHVITQSFRKRGVQIITGIGDILGIERTPDGLELNVILEGKPAKLTAEVILMAVGWIGNLETLNLEVTGARTERGYIIVNDYLQSSAPHIFAAGDITGRMMLVQSASQDARIAAENAVLGIGQPYHHQIVPHGGFTDPEYGSVGLTENQAKAGGQDYISAVIPFTDLDRAVIDDHTDGLCKLIVSQENHRILGAHVVGEQALEIVQLVAAGMASDMWVEQLAELEIAYPTYAAVAGLAARRIMTDLGVVPMSSEWHSLGIQTLAEWEKRVG
jgi:dihydrolipoamide dehydrogenase